MPSTPSPSRARLIAVDGDCEPRLLNRLLEAITESMRRVDEVVLLAEPGIDLSSVALRHRRVTVAAHAHHRLPRQLKDLSGGERDVIVIAGSSFPTGRGWLDALTEPLAGTAGVAATVPSTNGAPWPQCPVDVPSFSAERPAIREFVRAHERKASVNIEIERAAGPAIAMSASALMNLPDELVAFDTATLAAACRRVGPLTLAAASYIHATKDLPLISACMIIKDEVSLLVECLASLESVADEIVIYDTGSTDGSIELARALGATVIEGYWDDDFGRARNAALRCCRGEWVLHVDADEIVEHPERDGPVIRTLLSTSTNADVVAVNLFNLEGSRIAPVRSLAPNLVARFFRRTHCQWRGALHEEPVARPGKAPARYTKTGVLTLLHSGYLAEAITERDKRNRNLRISSLEAGAEAEAVGDTDRAQFNLARSLLMAHKHDEAVEAFDVIGRNSTHDVIRRSSLELGSDALRELGRCEEALEWADRHCSENPQLGVGKLLRAQALAMLGRVDEAIVLVTGLTNYNDRYSNVGTDGLAVFTAQTLVHTGRFSEALTQLQAAIAVNVRSSKAYMTLARLIDVCPTTDPTPVLGAVPVDELTSIYSQLLQAPPAGADRIAETMWSLHPGDLATLAFASNLSPSLPTRRALTWSRRLADFGLAGASPLTALLAAATGTDEAMVLAMLVDTGQEDRRPRLEELVTGFDDADLIEVFKWVLGDAIGAADSVIVAGATSSVRCIAISRVLAERGHYNEAVAVFGHAAALTSSPLCGIDSEFEAAIRNAATQIGRPDVLIALNAAVS